MKILAIETSCDETAVSLVEQIEEKGGTKIRVLGNKLLSQAALHEKYGGVFPNLAKREHARNISPLLVHVLKEAGAFKQTMQPLTPQDLAVLHKYLEREPGLIQELIQLITAVEKPSIDAIAVTHGPGLEPALWVGINTARVLAHVWQLPVIPVNHMEGHILSSLLQKTGEQEFVVPDIAFPALALLISGGHTELVLLRGWNTYEIIGSTRDDAVGEAFDKAARMLNLPYPGGPQISKYAEAARASGMAPSLELPRPMLRSKDYHFSFSGLKTAVRYYIESLSDITEKDREEISLAFEDAVTEVLLSKSKRAVNDYGIKTFIMGGGVSANTHLRKRFGEELSGENSAVEIYIPPLSLTTDNAVMIAVAAFYRTKLLSSPAIDPHNIRAEGNLKLA